MKWHFRILTDTTEDELFDSSDINIPTKKMNDIVPFLGYYNEHLAIIGAKHAIAVTFRDDVHYKIYPVVETAEDMDKVIDSMFNE